MITSSLSIQSVLRWTKLLVAFAIALALSGLVIVTGSARPAGAYPLGPGYMLIANDGGAFTFGASHFYGSLGALKLAQPIVGGAEDPFLEGYWMVAKDGGVFAFGSSAYYGSLPGEGISVGNVVGITSTPPGLGYWIASSNGGVFSFGDAHFYGSAGATHLNVPIVGMAATPDGAGYWLVASDGGIFSYGDAQFYGSTGATHLNSPIVGMAATPDGKGYWLVASDGGVFTFGDAQFYGSTGSLHLNKPIVGMAATPDGAGYWLVSSDGGIFTFGDAGFYGSAGGTHLNVPIVGMLARPPLAVKVDAYGENGTSSSNWIQAGGGTWQLELTGGTPTTPAGARVLGVEGLNVSQLGTLGFTVASGTCDGNQPSFVLEARNASGGIDTGTFACSGSGVQSFNPTSQLPGADVVTSLDIVEPTGTSALTNIQAAGITVSSFRTYTSAGTTIN